jgi:hypothetical protein
MYVFLTACRNEEQTIHEFWTEFVAMAEKAGLLGQTALYVVDDFSTDGTAAILQELQQRASGIDLRIIRAPTNFGNQGAMFHGLRRLEIRPDDVLVTFDSDGEDDVGQIASIIELGARAPGKVVLIERGSRREPLLFKLFFASYKLLFRFFTRQTVVPNNFMLLPGGLVPVVQRSPLAAVHFAYAILRLRPTYVKTVRDRRTRYGGQSSQNLFMLVSHGLVGLMVFFEVVVAKIFMLLFLFGLFAAAVTTLALALPSDAGVVHRVLFTAALGTGVGTIGLFGLLLSAALALIFKLATFMLIEAVALPGPRLSSRSGPPATVSERPGAPTLQREAATSAPGAARSEEFDKEAS